MAERTFYLTTAIDYANGVPHVGHALEKIGADAIARYHRLRGERVHFLMGMDEHGQKVAQSAAAEGISPREWTDRIAREWQAAWKVLDISYTDFIRTTEPRHRRAVEEMIRRMQERGDLYRGLYAGYYCVGCEAYKTEDELVEGRCPIHPAREIQWMEEEDWFFRLSAYQQELLRLLEEQPWFVQPESRRNEVRRMIEEIKDISVSRSNLDWGIPWPGDPEQVVYVWIDALTNYLSATGFPEPGYREIWPAELHVIGKDIIRFHCVYWPAMLMSAGVELPRQVWAHGFMNLGGRKISKSEGTWVGPQEAAERYGPDALRYFVLREVPWDGDGSFTWERFDERYTAELANGLGNLVNRTVSMILKYRDGVVPSYSFPGLDPTSDGVVEAYRKVMDRCSLQEGLRLAFYLVSEANSYIQMQKPWTLARDPMRAASLNETLGSLVRALAVIATLLFPFMPGKMAELWRRLGAEAEDLPLLDELPRLEVAGWRVQGGEVLFPRPELAGSR